MVGDKDGPAPSPQGASELFEDETRRFDPAAFDAPLEAPAVRTPVVAVAVVLPAAVLVVDADRRRGAQTAAKLMEHGYTCAVVVPSEVAAVVGRQTFDVLLLEVEVGQAETAFDRARVFSGPIVVSSPAAIATGPEVALLLLKPWLTEQMVQALEEARRRRGPDALAPPTIEALAHDLLEGETVAEPDAAAPPAFATPPSPSAPPEQGVAARVPSSADGPGPETHSVPLGLDTWDAFRNKVVRARIADRQGEGFTPARIRAARADGFLDVECRRRFEAKGTAVEVELVLADSRRASFEARVSNESEDGMTIALSVQPADVPFFHMWLAECGDVSLRSEPAKIAWTESKPAPEPDKAGAAATSLEVDRLWAEASANLDDDAAQQRFIQRCLKSGQIELAVRRYRGLKEASPDDERAQKYLQQVGTILGFYALKQTNEVDNETGMSWRLKLVLGLFVLSTVILFVLSRIAV